MIAVSHLAVGVLATALFASIKNERSPAYAPGMVANWSKDWIDSRKFYVLTLRY